MLVLSRKSQEQIYIDVAEACRIVIRVAEIRGDKVRLAFDAPKSANIVRSEIDGKIPRPAEWTKLPPPRPSAS